MYEKITLPNGVRIVHEFIPYVRSAALGIWVGTGSRYEAARMSGASHFIEHMLFKGTETHSASDLADIMDGIGGQVNAFTTKECTCFHGRVLDSHLDQLTDVLCDMFFHSRFDEEDVKNERGVILEEIDMYKDTPEDLASERLQTVIYKGCSLARPVLGLKPALESMTGESLRAHKAEHYRPRSVVVALSGSYTPADIERLRDRFSNMGEGGEKTYKPAMYTPAFIVKRKSLEQNHLMLAFPGLSITDKRRYALQVLSDILGGGMSSRLFQTVREQRGLCYSVYTYGSSYTDTGMFAVYTALNKETERAALEVIKAEIIRLRDGVTTDELTRTREQIKANILMSLEQTGSRMHRLGKNELFLGIVPELDDIIARYDNVTAEDIRSLSSDLLDFSKASFSAVGRVENADYYRELLS